MSSESSSPSTLEGQRAPASHGTSLSYDAIALRAYFIALDRHRRGEPGDPLKDWVEAEQQLSHPDGNR